jgi:hypothetical protein
MLIVYHKNNEDLVKLRNNNRLCPSVFSTY